jgi:hypothetical protein
MKSSGITIIISIAAINWLTLEAIWTKSKIRKGVTVYSAPKGLKALFGIAIAFALYGALESVLSSPRQWWLSVGLVAFAGFWIYFFPATILVSQKGITSIKGFGVRKLEMDWRDIDAIYSNPEDRSIIVQDKWQRQITHTIYNVDRAGFIDQVRTFSSCLAPKITWQV